MTEFVRLTTTVCKLDKTHYALGSLSTRRMGAALPRRRIQIADLRSRPTFYWCSLRFGRLVACR
jgi:hypothetical protein